MPNAFDEPIFEGVPDEPFRSVKTPPTSTAAILSAVFGVLSPLLICTCFLWIPAALAAMVAGHVARYQIRKSAGKLGGEGLAFVGLVTGYSIITIGSIIGFMLWVVPRSPPAIGSLRYAEDRLTASDREFASGNSTEAVQLASQFVELMQTLDCELFASIPARQSIIGTECFVWCEMRPDKCAFLVQIDEYDDLTAERQKAIETASWIALQKAVARSSQPLKMVGVGLRGRRLIRSVTVGIVAPALSGDEIVGIRGTASDMEIFFTDDSLDLDELMPK